MLALNLLLLLAKNIYMMKKCKRRHPYPLMRSDLWLEYTWKMKNKFAKRITEWNFLRRHLAKYMLQGNVNCPISAPDVNVALFVLSFRLHYVYVRNVVMMTIKDKKK